MEKPEDLAAYYASDAGYYSFQTDPFERKSRLGKLASLCKDFAAYKVAPRVQQFFPTEQLERKWITMIQWKRGMRILDVGCGNGYFLKELSRLGFRNLTGIDPFLEHDKTFAPGCQLKKSSIEQLDGQYDLIVLSHSLEHMENQQSAMESIKRLLSPQGKAVILIPVYSDHFMRTYGDCWFAWDIPIHFHLHSVKSLNLLATQAGLRVEKHVYHGLVECLLASERNLANHGENSAAERLRQRSLADWKKDVVKLNRQQQSDCCNFLLSHA
jgi:SAM-dependent methyltransferase